jgi:DNA-binding NtrC family response regulator
MSPSPPSAAAGSTVLVVDDDAAVVAFCKKILQQAGFSTLSASGSSDALKICKQHGGRIDLLLTDLVLPPPEFSFASSENEFPHVHGHELALRALRMRKDLHVILMSGNPDTDLAGYGIQKGVLPFLSKPIDPSAFVSLVKQTLQASPPTPESLLKQPSAGAKGADEWFD